MGKEAGIRSVIPGESAAVYNYYHPLAQVSQKLALYMMASDFVRAGKSSILTSGHASVYSLRTVADSFEPSAVFKQLHASFKDYTYGKVTLESLENMLADATSLDAVYADIQQTLASIKTMEAEMKTKGVDDAEANMKVNAAISNLGKDIMSKYVRDNDVYRIAVASKAITNMSSDPEAAIPVADVFSSLWTNTFTEYLRRCTTSLLVTDRALAGGDIPVTYQPNQLLDGARVVNFKDVLSILNRDVDKDLFFVPTERDATTAAFTYQTMANISRLNLIHTLPVIAADISAHHKVQDTASQFSDHKEFNLLMAEMKRDKRMKAIQVFIILESSIAYAQMLMTTLCTDPILHSFKAKHPLMADEIKPGAIKDLLMALPVGKFTAQMMAGLTIPTQYKFASVSLGAVNCVSEQNPADPDDATSSLMGQLLRWCEVLHPILTNSALMELYRQGSEVCSGQVPSISTDMVDLDTMNVMFSQFGRVKSLRPISQDDLFNAAHMGWGINRNNTAAALRVGLNGVTDNLMLEPFHYGEISMPKFKAGLAMHLAKFPNAAIPPSTVILMNLPGLALNRKTRADAALSLYFDPAVTSIGPACSVPMEARSVTPIMDGSNKSSFAKKEVVGSYQLKRDTIAMPVTVVTQEPVPFKNTDLDVVLNFDPSLIKLALKDAKHPLSRLAVAGDPDQLLSSLLAHDDYFRESIAYTYVVLSATRGTEPYLGGITRSLVLNANPDGKAVTSRAVPLRTYLNPSAPTSGSEVRLEGAIQPVDQILVIPSGDDAINVATMIGL